MARVYPWEADAGLGYAPGLFPSEVIIMRAMFVALALSVSVLTAAFTAGAEEPKAKFPMPAAAFKTREAAHIEKSRARMEAHITSKKLDAEKAKRVRARFEGSVVKINQAVTKVAADGTVTKEEAKEVRQVARAGRGHHGKRAKG